MNETTPPGMSPNPTMPPLAAGQSPMRWIIIGLLAIVLIAGAIYVLLGSQDESLPLPAHILNKSTPVPTGTPVSLDNQIINDIKTTMPGRDVSSIDQDIQNSNLDSASQDLDALDKEIKGL